MSAKHFLVAFAALLSVVNAVEDNVERRDTFWWGNKKPVASKFTLINTVSQTKLFDLYDGTKIDICKLGHVGIHSPTQLNIGVDTTGAVSVDFYKGSHFYRRDPQYFFSLCGDNGGHPYYGCKDLSYGHQCITAIPWSMANGQGICGDKLTVCFDIVGCPAPVTPPVRAPVPAPVNPPVRAPVPAPVTPPKAAPVRPPVNPPVMPPKAAPVTPPKAAPVRPPVHPPVPAPVTPPKAAPVTPPKAAPVTPPVRAPVVVHPVPVPVPAPVKPPVHAPVPAPVRLPVPAPVTPPVRAPVAVHPVPTPIRMPVPAPVNPPIKPPVRAPVVVVHPVPAPVCPPKYKYGYV
jgi:hypothetical protein